MEEAPRFVIQKENWLPCLKWFTGIHLPSLYIRKYGLRRIKILAPARDSDY